MSAVEKAIVAQRATPELAAYYADSRLMWRNIILIGICNMGWGLVFTIVGPLMTLKLLESGFAEGIQGTLTAANSVLSSFFVMYFSWKSDHTVSAFGRRKPFLFLSAPFIILSILLFAFNDYKWSLLIFMAVQMLFMDVKLSTFSLLPIDCIPREKLARIMSVLAIVGGLMGFLSMRNMGTLLAVGEWMPYVLGAGVMTLTTASSYFIKEPPIKKTSARGFRLWSVFEVGWKDRRMILLMLGVGTVSSFICMNDTWSWFWAKTALGLEKKDIFEAVSWCALINVALAYPVGYVIDRWGGLKVTIVYWGLQVLCFFMAMNVYNKLSFTLLMMTASIAVPLYSAADIMVYKTVDPADVGSITSCNSFMRNAYRGALVFCSGWLISLTGQNYKLAFMIGILMSTLGLLLMFAYQRIVLSSEASKNDSDGLLKADRECISLPALEE